MTFALGDVSVRYAAAEHPNPPESPRVSSSVAGIELSVYGDLYSVEKEWREFATRAKYTPFQAFDGLTAWQRHIGGRRGVRPVIVVGRNAEGRLLFILPLAMSARSGVRRLTWLGSELADYNAPVLAEDFSDWIDRRGWRLLWPEVLGLLRLGARSAFHVVDLQKMPATIDRERNPCLSLPVMLNPSGAYSTGLAGDWHTFYLSRRSAATRQRDRTKVRRLAEYGAVRFLSLHSSSEIERTLLALMDQKTRSFAQTGVANVFARPGYRALFLALAANPGLGAFVHVSRLDIGSTLAATNLGLTLHGCYYHVLSSYGDGGWSRFGPGAAHLRELLRLAIERGFHRFDFTIGAEPYKRDWSDTSSNVYDHFADHFAAVTSAGWPILAVSAASRRRKRFIKQNPLLWRVFCKARRFAGSMAQAALLILAYGLK